MIDAWNSLINGIFFAIGTVIVTTVAGYLIFRRSRDWLTKTIAEMWVKIKEEGLKVEGKVETKRKKK